MTLRSSPSRRLIALSLLFNLPFVVFHVYRMAFDTYTHIFLADHYWQRWWSLWEPRWYLGFSVASYPPLVHQLIALLARPITAITAFFAPEPELYPGAFRLMGEEAAFALLALAIVAAFPLAVRAYTRTLLGPRAAGWAGLAAVALPALSLSAWAFGQMPNIAATTLVLLACARAGVYARSGNRWALAQAVALSGLAGATHHGAFLFYPFAALVVIARGAQLALRAREPLRHYFARVALWLGLSAAAVLLVLWPFLQWSAGQALQTPIDHASRHDFLADPLARRFFFWPVYGPLLGLIPLAFWMARASARWRPLLAAFGLLFLLGLGGTTPLPALLFGPGWQWLVYERFGFWAALCLLPFAGAVLLAAERRFTRRWGLALFGGLLVLGSWSGWLSVISRAQPPAVDLVPIVRFLDEPAQRPYRYLTLGFGDQMARLSAATDNGTPDGDYHTARGLPELRTSGLGTLDGALWNPQGVWALWPFLSHPERYGVRWAFVAHEAYIPVLQATGWRYRFMVGAVAAWEHPAGAPLPLRLPPENRLAALWWGIAPLAMLAAALVTALAPRLRFSRQRLVQQVAGLRRILWAAAVVALFFWWLHVYRPGTLVDAYFVYQSLLAYASDLLLVAALAVWGLERALRGQPLRWGPRSLALAGLALIAACLLSAPTSLDPPLTLAFAAHLVLLAGAYLLCVNDPPSPASMGWLSAGLLATQIVPALVQVMTQRTGWPAGLHLPWPGAIAASESGASVVGAADGMRWLRAYGTLPHPNLLGGCLLIGLGIVVERYIATGRRPWLIPAIAGTVALFLTFSRSAWVGMGVLATALWIALPRDARPRAVRAAFAMGLAFGIMALAFRPIVLARIGASPAAVTLENRSTGQRLQLLAFGLQAIREHPLAGLGAGTFVEWIYTIPGQPAPFEPVHAIPVLIVAETGLGGLLAGLALAAAVGFRLRHRRKQMLPLEATWSAILVGILAIALADHYWWTMAPMRTLFVLVLGIWVAGGELSGAKHSR